MKLLNYYLNYKCLLCKIKHKLIKKDLSFEYIIKRLNSNILKITKNLDNQNDYQLLKDKHIANILFNETLIEFLNYKNKEMGNFPYYNVINNEIKLSGSELLSKHTKPNYAKLSDINISKDLFTIYDYYMFYCKIIMYAKINIKIINIKNGYKDDLSYDIKYNITKEDQMLLYILIKDLYNKNEINKLNNLYYYIIQGSI